MNRKGTKRHNNEIEYWQPTSDMLISVLLILLLVIVLLGLYLLHIPETKYPGSGDDEIEATTEYGREEHREDHLYDNPYENLNEADDGDGAVHGGGIGEGTDDEPGDTTDEGVKSAVQVMLVDAETKRTVKEEGVTFELYETKKGLQSLNTYYPEKITYKDYATTEDGTFYLPEKIWQGKYYFHEITEPLGYDSAEDETFRIKKLYDWPDPYVVKIPVYPSRNIIRLQMNDKDTDLAVTGGSFNVIAAEDIITADGTLRYKAGEVTGEIILNEQGYGESEPLYLGKYNLVQNIIPQYYAGVKDNITATVEKKTGTEPALHEIFAEKTRISIRVTDELYEDRALDGVHYEIYADGQPPTSYTTDKTGAILLEDLDKNVSYHIKQAEQYGNYLIDSKIHDVAVDSVGRIDSQAHAHITLTNRMIRVVIHLTDALLGSQVTDENLAIYDGNGKVIRTWTTTGVEDKINDLTPGNYQVVRNGKKANSYLLTVENTAELQELTITLFTWRSGLVIAVGVLVLIIIIAGLRASIGAVIKNRKKNKKPAQISDIDINGKEGGE